MTESKITSKSCGVALPSDHTGPCPNCRNTGRHIKVEPLSGVLRPTGTLAGIKRRRREIVKDKRIKWASRRIGLICALGGAFLSAPLLYSLIVAGALYAITVIQEMIDAMP